LYDRVVDEGEDGVVGDVSLEKEQKDLVVQRMVMVIGVMCVFQVAKWVFTGKF
jgi:hypothetical protein